MSSTPPCHLSFQAEHLQAKPIIHFGLLICPERSSTSHIKSSISRKNFTLSKQLWTGYVKQAVAVSREELVAEELVGSTPYVILCYLILRGACCRHVLCNFVGLSFVVLTALQ